METEDLRICKKDIEDILTMYLNEDISKEKTIEELDKVLKYFKKAFLNSAGHRNEADYDDQKTVVKIYFIEEKRKIII